MTDWTVPRRIGVVGYARYASLDTTVERFTRLVGDAGLDLFLEEGLQELVPGSDRLTDDLVSSLDLLVTFGGDGTLLRGARLVAPYGIPVLGINLGRLGFLTSIGPAEIDQAFANLLSGDVMLDERMVLQVEAEREDREKHGDFLALNDVVLHRGGVARMLRLSIHAHGEEVGTYSSDGIILSTPTGSTAYSLSAGGPIVAPTLDCIIATPISPHTLAVRPLILSASETVTVEVLSPTEELILTIDGQQGARMLPGDRLVVSRAKEPLKLVRFPGQTFFSTLRRKLGWGDLEGRERG
jgi:NAD+ kinase